MNSEHRETESEPKWQADGDIEFLCRENPLVDTDEGRMLRSVFYGLPLRAGFTDEVLARIREEG
jgi:hypothetical protein